MCGNVPLPASGATATPDSAAGPTQIEIAWTASIDQDVAEQDVERYMVFRRRTSETDWGQPIGSVAASQPTYTFEDTDIQSGTWVWAIVAQDCSPSNSALVITPPVIIP